MIGDAVKRRQLAFQRVFITHGQRHLIILRAAVVDDPIKLYEMPMDEALTYLRDVLASWQYKIMERYGQSTREAEIDNISALRYLLSYFNFAFCVGFVFPVSIDSATIFNASLILAAAFSGVSSVSDFTHSITAL